MIRITLKNKNYQTLNTAADWFANVLKQSLEINVLGPMFPPISKIRNLYHKEILLKIEPDQSISITKKKVFKIQQSFQSITSFRSTRISLDVDPN